MGAGQLRDRVTFQREGAGTNHLGSTGDGTWSDLLTVWGGFKPDRGNEVPEGGGLAPQVSGKLTVRQSTETLAVLETDRVMIRDKAYQIRAIFDPTGMRKFLEMTVERGHAT